MLSGHTFEALKHLAARGDVEVIFPVHLNPMVQATAKQMLSDIKSIHLIDPLDYVPFVYLLQRCSLVITDSGGVQEEAPSLGKPIIVARDTTERSEGIRAGTAILAGTNTQDILKFANDLLDDHKKYQAMARAHNPYGDGNACQRIAKDLLSRIPLPIRR